MQRQSSREIERQAADWAARLDRGALSTEDERAFDEWRGADPRRLGAFMRMRAVALHTERAQALGPDYDPETYAAPTDQAWAVEFGTVAPINPGEDFERPSRRRFLMWGGGAAAAAGVAVTIGLGLFTSDPVYATGLGEVRVVTLEDGSVITLNTSTRVSVHMARDRRAVTLIEGEAMFDVAHDTSRLFTVDAGGTAVRAVGTSFTVRRLESQPVEVLVREGVVELTRPGAAAPVRMVANTRAVTQRGAAPAPAPVTADEMQRELAWRDGRIAFEGDTLGHAALAFARYSDTHIVVDPAVRNEEITGLFAANDPVSFARAAAASLDLKAQVGQGEVRISAR